MPFDQLFQMNTYSTPFPRDESVVAQLKEDRMFTTPAPLPEREAELEFLKQALDLKGSGLI